MFNVAVCDDNIEDGHRILSAARQIFIDRNIDADFSFFISPSKLLESITKDSGRYDLLLLDILFDKTNGIKLAQSIREAGSKAALIYTTVSRDFAIDGYKVQASDYLVKPINKDALADSIGRVLKKNDSILVESDGKLKSIQVSDIGYVEACANYVILRMPDGKETARMRATLTEVQKRLGNDRFARCHKGYLVNLGQVREVGTGNILLHSDDTVPLGRGYRAELQKSILEYIEKAIPR